MRHTQILHESNMRPTREWAGRCLGSCCSPTSGLGYAQRGRARQQRSPTSPKKRFSQAHVAAAARSAVDEAPSARREWHPSSQQGEWRTRRANKESGTRRANKESGAPVEPTRRVAPVEPTRRVAHPSSQQGRARPRYEYEPPAATRPRYAMSTCRPPHAAARRSRAAALVMVRPT